MVSYFENYDSDSDSDRDSDKESLTTPKLFDREVSERY